MPQDPTCEDIEYRYDRPARKHIYISHEKSVCDSCLEFNHIKKNRYLCAGCQKEVYVCLPCVEQEDLDQPFNHENKLDWNESTLCRWCLFTIECNEFLNQDSDDEATRIVKIVRCLVGDDSDSEIV